MTYALWKFDGQTNGVAPTIANSDDFGDPAWTAVSAGGTFLSYSSTLALVGPIDLLVNVTTNTTAVNLDKADTASANAAAETFIYITSYPSASGCQGPIAFRGSSANMARLQMNTTGQLQIVIGATNGTLAATALSLNTLYRIAAVATGFGTAASGVTCNVYSGFSTTPLFSVPSVTGQTTANQIDTIRWTKFGGTANVTYYMSRVQQDIGRSTEIGPPITTVDSTLALTATATAGDTLTSVVDSTLAVTATLSADATRTAPVASSLAVTATLTAGASNAPIGAASLAVTATIAATGAVTRPSAAALAVTATITAAMAAGSVSAAASLAVTATLAAGAFAVRPGAATLAVTATLTTTAFYIRPAAAALTLTATLVAGATLSAAAAASLAITATIIATASVQSLNIPGGTMVLSDRNVPALTLALRALPNLTGG